MRFPGSDILFYVMVLVVMMIPGVVTLTPSFVLATRLGLKGTLWGLAVTYVAGGQPFAIFIMNTFFRSQPEEIFESARVDGANEWQTLWNIAMPLARPIIVTLAIMNFLSIFGDLIWPSLMLRSENKTLMLALLNYNPIVEGEMTTRPRLGPITAAYVFSSIPPLIIFITGMKYYIQGLTSGAIKA
jgi:ABC-type glycerol-3-phosphate transport system permease component